MKVFFSHASEDKTIVEQIFLRVAQKYPDIKGWIDIYEIRGGDDLIDKINSAIDDASKFLIFLSSNSVDKPWVRIELKKALMSELNGVKPEFIIPIKIGHITQYPPFLESRFYIDLETKTENEWLDDIYYAITTQRRALETPAENLIAHVYVTPDNPNALAIEFEAKFWSEEISFIVRTNEDIVQSNWVFPSLTTPSGSESEKKTAREYAIRLVSKSISPTKTFAMLIEFSSPANKDMVISIGKWDGSNATISSLVF